MSSSKFPLLIVDDEPGIRTQMKWALQEQYEISEAGSRDEALDQLKKKSIPVVCLDLGLPLIQAELKKVSVPWTRSLKWSPPPRSSS